MANIGGNQLHNEAVSSEHGIPIGKWLSVFGDRSQIDSRLSDEGIS